MSTTVVGNPLSPAPTRRRSVASADKRRGRSRSPGAYLKSMVTKERKVPTTTAEENPSPSPVPSSSGGGKPLRRSRSSNDKRRGRSRSPGAYLRKKGKSLKGFFKTTSEKMSTRRMDASLRFSTSSPKPTPSKAVPMVPEESPALLPMTPAPKQERDDVPKQEQDDDVYDIEVDDAVSSEEKRTSSYGTIDAEEKKSEETSTKSDRDISAYDIVFDTMASSEVQGAMNFDADAGEEKKSEDSKDIEKAGTGANIVPAQLSQETVNSEFDAGEEKKSDDAIDSQDIVKTDTDATILPEKSSGTDVEETIISNTVQIILLLMDPASRRFELLQLEFDAAKAIVQDLLSQIPSSATEKSVRDQKYDGICTIDGEEMTCSEKLRDFVEQNEGINSVVLAMPEGVSAMKCAKMGLAILADSSVAAMVDPSGKMKSLVSKSETTEVEPTASDEPVELKNEEASEEEDMSNVISEPHVAPTVEKEIADATPEPSAATTDDANETAADVTKTEEVTVVKEKMVEDPVESTPEEASAEKNVEAVTPEMTAATTVVADEPAASETKIEEPTVDKDTTPDEAVEVETEKTSVENETSDAMSEASDASSHVADKLVSSMINIEEPTNTELTLEETLVKNEAVDATPEPSVATTDASVELAPSMTDSDESTSRKDAAEEATVKERSVHIVQKTCDTDASQGWEDVRRLITAIFVFFMPVIALCLSREHSLMSAPFSRGDVITPGVSRSYCGLYEKFPFVKDCETKLVKFDETGVLSLYHGDEVQWQIKGGKCNGSGKVECDARILEDGSVWIAGKRAQIEGNNKEGISPWPFAEEVVFVTKRKLGVDLDGLL